MHTVATSMRYVDEQAEAEYAERRCDEQALLDRYPGLLDKSDSFLMELAADPPGLFDDADEVQAVALIVLDRRLSGTMPCVPAERDNLLAELQASVMFEQAIATLPEPDRASARRRVLAAGVGKAC